MPKQKIKKEESISLHLDSEISPTKKDFRDTFQWRVFRIMAEFIDGFHFIANFKKTVSVFGSARLSSENKYYQEASKLGQLLAKTGYTMITGGGPGIMEAANRGAFEANGKSVGLNIQLPGGQKMNPYVKSPMGFNYFFTRKVMLSFASQAYVFSMQDNDAQVIGEFVNIGAGKDIQIKELAILIKEMVGYNGEIKWDTSKPDGTPKKLLDISRMDKLGWKARIGVEEGIGLVYKHYVR